MTSILPHLFTGIGFTITLFGVGYATLTLIDKIQDSAKERRERFQRLISALERIEATTRNKPTQG